MSKKSKCIIYLESKESIFSGLSLHEKELLFEGHSCSDYKKGEIIFKEGDKPSCLLCLCVGKVKVFKEGVGGREQIVRMTKAVSLIGYRALFAESNYISSGVAIEDSTIAMIDKEIIIHLLRSNSEFSMRIIKHMACELGMSNIRTVSLTQKHIRGRLAESIIFLRDTYGFENDGVTIKIYLSREDLANLSSMTTSNAIRTLSAFASEKVIDLDGRKIKILDIERLERISDMG